jgi:hypothetical protein
MKKIAVVAVIILLVTGGLFYWLWRQVTTLPEWYTAGGSGGDIIIYGQGIDIIRKSLEHTMADGLQQAASASGEIEVVLDEHDANKLVAVLISEGAGKHPFLRAVKASRTRIRDGRIDVGVVVDASGIVGEASGEAAVGLSGVLQGREISVGATGGYGLENGNLQLDPEGEVRIGGFTFSQETVSKRLGISENKILKPLGNLEMGRFRIDTIKPGQNTLRLKGTASRP